MDMTEEEIRKLQTITLLYNEDPQTEYGDDSSTGGQATGAGTRSGNTARCRAVRSDDAGPLEVEVDTTLKFWYEAETVGINPTPAYQEEDMPPACDKATVYAFADELCGMEGWDCILFVSVGKTDSMLTGSNDNLCQDEDMVGDGACAAYQGDIVVQHTDNCTKDEIRDYFVTVMNDDTVGMASDKYLGNVNDFAESGSTGNLDDEVIAVRLANPSSGNGGAVVAGIAGVPTAVVTDESVSAGGWAVAALVGLILLALLAMLFVMRRRGKKDAQKLEDDLRSLHTEWSNGGASMGAKSYMTADARNLAAAHSKLDVHKCKSATCEVCNANLGRVDMLPVNQSEASTALAMRNAQALAMAPEQKPWREESRRVPRAASEQGPTHVEFYQMPQDSSTLTDSRGDANNNAMLL